MKRVGPIKVQARRGDAYTMQILFPTVMTDELSDP